MPRGRLRPTALPLLWVLSVALLLGPFGTFPGGPALADSEPRRVDPAPAGAPSDIEALMASLAATGGVRARFRETRHISLLSEPLETEGTLLFAPPDRLARHTTRPGRSSAVVRGSRVEFRDEIGHQVIELGPKDVARDLVENLMVLMRGDLAALRDRYTVSFRADGATWELTLEPRSRALGRFVEWIRFQGRGAVVTGMETRETTGDTTVTAFTDVETGLEFTDAEIARLFSLDGSP